MFDLVSSTDKPVASGVLSRVGHLARQPYHAVARGIDNMKMTALSAWAVDQLGQSGAQTVEIDWAYGSPRVQIQANFYGEENFVAVSDEHRRRDQAVMWAVSKIIDDRIEFLIFRARQRDAGAWWTIFDLPPDAGRAQIESAYRDLARRVHPDLGGPEASAERMAEINTARDKALRAIVS